MICLPEIALECPRAVGLKFKEKLMRNDDDLDLDFDADPEAESDAELDGRPAD